MLIRDLAQSADQRQAILKQAEEFMLDVVLLNNDVLVASYVGSDKTRGGVILPDKSLTENLYQGKTGLVLQVGPEAFRYRGGYSYFTKHPHEADDDYDKRVRDLTPQFGDWVLFRVTDTWMLRLGTLECRIVPDVCIKGKVADPGVAW
jgi:hypothetical protein